MVTFRSAHGTGNGWAYAVKECIDGLGELPAAEPGKKWIGFLYVTDAFSGDLSSILTYVKHKISISHWIGTIGSGIIVDAWEYHGYGAIGILAGQFDEDSFHVLPPLHDQDEDLKEVTQAWIKASSPTFAVIHADPASQGVIGLIEGLAKTMGDLPVQDLDNNYSGGFRDGFLVGGMTASNGQGYQIADKLNGNGISGVAFSPQVDVVTGLSQGCQQLGDIHLVNQVVDNVIMRLDDETALDVLKNDVGELLARDLARLPGYVHAAIPVPGTDTGEFMVRNILGIDTDRGWVAIGDRTLEAGDQLGFVRSDPVRARANMDHMLDDLKSRIPSQPKGGLYFSCVSRGPLLFGTSGEEARIIRAALGPIPIVGFYGNGEIFNSRLHQYSSVLVLFC